MGRKYTIYGYKGKQVRDNIHSWDLVNMFWHFFQNPKCGAVYNAGGSRQSHCSMLEAISHCECISGRKLIYEYNESNRNGDHIWYVSDVSKFGRDYPDWNFRYDLNAILEEIHTDWKKRFEFQDTGSI
jgi:CDP-paratose 2-epimerase